MPRPNTQSDNRHGLSRTLREEVRRCVRRRCGYGCVVCGSAIIQYHHFDPPFADAKEHNPEGITLLCGRHHDEATRGLLSPESVRRHNSGPFALRQAPHHLLDLSPPIRLILGSIIIDNPSGPFIVIDNEELFSLTLNNAEILLSARFFDDSGKMVVDVRDSELRFRADSWDATVVGSQVKVWSSKGEVAFEATLHPPRTIYVRRINVSLNNKWICSDESGNVRIGWDAGNRVDLQRDHCMVADGPIVLNESEKQIRGGVMMTPYPGDRLLSLGKAGKIDQLSRELTQPAIHVVQHRDRLPLPQSAQAPIPGAPTGMVRYPLVCQVCHKPLGGHYDQPVAAKPPEYSDAKCEDCILPPPRGWAVQLANGRQVSCHMTREEAERAAQEHCRHCQPSHIIVHHTDGELRFWFPDPGSG